MYLDKDELVILFNHYLDEYLLPRSFNHLSLFEEMDKGNVLTRRLFLVLRSRELYHLIAGDKVEVLEVYKLAKEYLEKHKKIFLVGLNYWFSLYDLEELKKFYERLYIR